MTGNGASARQTSRSQSVALVLLRASPHTEPQSSEVRLPHPDDYLRLYLTQFTGAFLTISHASKEGVKATLPNTRQLTQAGCQTEVT